MKNLLLNNVAAISLLMMLAGCGIYINPPPSGNTSSGTPGGGAGTVGGAQEQQSQVIQPQGVQKAMILYQGR
jgi:hypothetical protein